MDDNRPEIKDTENLPETELNEDGVPRPAPDPKNGLYTVISLLLFAALYIGGKFISENFFVPYTVTLTEFSERSAQILNFEASEIIPESAVLSYARLSYGTDDNRLYLRYELSAREEYENYLLSESFITENPDGEEIAEERISVYRNEYSDLDYVYGNIYASTEYPDIILRVYENDGRDYAEIIKTKYDSSVRSAFKEGIKIKYENERAFRKNRSE